MKDTTTAPTITLDKARELYAKCDYAMAVEPRTINGEAIYFNYRKNTYKVYNGVCEYIPMSKNDFILFVQGFIGDYGFRIAKNTSKDPA